MLPLQEPPIKSTNFDLSLGEFCSSFDPHLRAREI